MNSLDKVRWPAFAGLFCVTLATLMYEILLTRIFSVTMWYHYAFMVISVTLFGLTVGAIIVYVFPRTFTQERVKIHLALSSLLFSLSIVLSFLIHLLIPFNAVVSLVGFTSILVVFILFSIPFVFGGIVVALVLTKFPRQVSKLYAADLAGAAAGCILIIYTLDLTDGPTAVLVVGFIVSLGSVFFAVEADSPSVRRAGVVLSLLLGFFAISHTLMVNNQAPLVRLTSVKGGYEAPAVWENWNSFSRIRVFGDSNALTTPVGWGINRAIASQFEIRQLHMNIDASAETIMTAFDGNLASVEYLKYDVTNVAHYIRPQARVLVIGSGGGRDILSALAFEQKEVIGIELNEVILDAVNNRFGEFTGHLDQLPSVTVVNDEARSYLERQKDRFDMIQISLIDTWAATAAGAFVLSENSLYTIEAWQTFLARLTPDGVLSVSRWYLKPTPIEFYRLTTLTAASLLEQGAENPRDHIVIVRSIQDHNPDQSGSVGTLLASRSPFSDQDLDIIQSISDRADFEVVLSPRINLDKTLGSLASGRDLPALSATFPLLNIDPPTDDSPFFFNMVRMRAVFNPEAWDQSHSDTNFGPVFILGGLLITVTLLTILCIVLPILITTRRRDDRLTINQAALPIIFFAGIGFGFMLVEISQLQRLIVFLGHPTYGLSVVLFSLLLFSGIGSYVTQAMPESRLASGGIPRLALLLGVLIIFGVVTPNVINAYRGATTSIRILIALAMLAPLGLLMGMAFPLGMKLAHQRWEPITPWLWGINGATSVCASVLAVVIALSISISTAFWVGFACYLVAFTAFFWATRAIGRQGQREYLP